MIEIEKRMCKTMKRGMSSTPPQPETPTLTDCKTQVAGKCTLCTNGSYLTMTGICLPADGPGCPPGFIQHGSGTEGKECKECNGQARRRNLQKTEQAAAKCDPCGNGRVSKTNHDGCQNIQDTCDQSQCRSCAKCIKASESHLTGCLDPKDNCTDFNKVWCPGFMDALTKCEGFSLGCYHKLLCHSPQICPSWKTHRCGVKCTPPTSCSFLQTNSTSEVPSESSVSQIFSQRNRVSSSHVNSLDAALQGKCSG